MVNRTRGFLTADGKEVCDVWIHWLDPTSERPDFHTLHVDPLSPVQADAINSGSADGTLRLLVTAPDKTPGNVAVDNLELFHQAAAEDEEIHLNLLDADAWKFFRWSAEDYLFDLSSEQARFRNASRHDVIASSCSDMVPAAATSVSDWAATRLRTFSLPTS
ncbi:hypothetical protein O1R50_08830 [Glycomyces luteolus]|uniref:Uncharacterized protein n=1 Tax=Glycomyces luteolus TaxID=2670330 RepID=A0A9X3P7U8_9ACTN|nr:hypothetical protein [Glycomyces luteolus]MDA1359724.1 hypothetical protein [Glycomyces luteolus]